MNYFHLLKPRVIDITKSIQRSFISVVKIHSGLSARNKVVKASLPPIKGWLKILWKIASTTI